MHYRLYSLADITNTRQYQNTADVRQARNQQQNFDTVIQTIGMRANITYDSPPRVALDIPSTYGLEGDELASIWIFEWRCEREFLFLDDGDHVGYLKQLFKLVPYIPNLTETNPSELPVFMPGKNITFKMLV